MRPEMLHVDCLRFTEATVAFCEAVGQTSYMPALLRSGLLVPIIKIARPKEPADWEPIALFSAFRGVISSALASTFRRHYIVHLNQWGFLVGSNSEILVAHVANRVSIGASCAAILDFKRAYDEISRACFSRISPKRASQPIPVQTSALVAPLSLQA